MTLRASITLMPNIHLLGISELLSVTSKTILCYWKYYHVAYISHKLFATLFIDEVKYNPKDFSCLYFF